MGAFGTKAPDSGGIDLRPTILMDNIVWNPEKL